MTPQSEPARASAGAPAVSTVPVTTHSLTAPGGLWTPTQLGRIHARNRLAMAPMTRRRAAEDGTPTASMSTYYAQRASFGLVITEGTYPSVEGRAYPHQPGILASHTPGWAGVTRQVHERGGQIVLQLMHAGRLTHPDITGAATVLAPSAIAYEPDPAHASHAPGRNPTPQAATTADIAQLIDDHVSAARNAVDSGFDGVELHGANGYLLQQFLAPNTNQRIDRYGASPANRARFVIELTEAIAAAIGADRVGLRISPGANIQGADESDSSDLVATYTALAQAVRPLGIAYLSIIHPDIKGPLVHHLRTAFASPLIANTGFKSVTDRHQAHALIKARATDIVAVGRPAIANPDLPRRWKTDEDETAPDPATFYTGGDNGYIDYPVCD